MIKKKAVAGGIVALAAVLGGGGIFAWTRRTADTETLADNQKYVYAYVTSIEGNELTYMEVDESVVEAYLASSTEDTENAEKGGDGSGVPEGSDGSGAPGGSDTAGAPGDGSGAPGDSTEASGDGSGASGRMSADDARKLEKETAEDSKIHVMEEDVEEHMSVSPPTKLKNPALFKPFEIDRKSTRLNSSHP